MKLEPLNKSNFHMQITFKRVNRKEMHSIEENKVIIFKKNKKETQRIKSKTKKANYRLMEKKP